MITQKESQQWIEVGLSLFSSEEDVSKAHKGEPSPKQLGHLRTGRWHCSVVSPPKEKMKWVS